MASSNKDRTFRGFEVTCANGKHQGYMVPGVTDRCIVCAGRDHLVFGLGVAFGDFQQAVDRNGALLADIDGLLKYVAHLPDCKVEVNGPITSCTCGLNNLLVRLPS